ncbi:MAG: accD [Chlamydiales bacterium]|jgi:acetyl-CoA carboxylase carboxyl transferase subunit beta|nr:accD [Chlamydiales bacterium]
MSLFSREKPKIKIQTTKKDGFSGWLKCSHCNELIHMHELEKNLNCCPKCDYHYRLSVKDRIENLIDVGTFVELFGDYTPLDTLKFSDTETYVNRLAEATKKSGSSEAVITGTGDINKVRVALAVFDFNFMAGSMGSVVGEKITLLIEYAMSHSLPLVIVTASGGARMQESVLSLMQMAKTSAALARFHAQGLLYISVLTNPTCGGTTASFATLGDIIIAEPNALICFAGPRVIEQTIKQQLPPDAQKSEFLLHHGMIDCIVKRHQLKQYLAEFLNFFTPSKQAARMDISNKAPSSKALKKRLPANLDELMDIPIEKLDEEFTIKI